MIITRVAVAAAAVVATASGAVVGHVTAAPASAETAVVAASESPAPTDGAAPSGSPSPKPSGESYTPPLNVTEERASNGVTVRSKVKTTDKVFFITIDDGWSQQEEAADYVASTKLPVTSFLTDQAVSGNWNFFRRISAFDAVQNHTMTHKALSKDSTDREFEICQAQKVYEGKYGTAPWILRPPYGAGFMPLRSSAPSIEKTAASCGIKHIALWNVTVDKNGKMEFAGTPYQRGDIVLLHFEGDLKANLQMLVKAYAKHGLKPASLSQYLAN